MNIKILIATHCKYQMPADGIYIPVRVNNGAADDDFGYQGDDEGENISAKNPNFCELTVLYWGWKNLKCDYMGLAHYRRHFSASKKGKDKHDWVLTGEEAENVCSQNDVVLPKRRRYYIENLWKHYEHTHDISHLIKTREIIARRCPDYLPAYNKVMKRTWCHMFNMFLMKKSLADQYCEWLFPILFDLEKQVDLTGLSRFDARLFGRVSELLLDVWIEVNNLDYKEVGFVQMGNENWPRKIWGFLMAKFFGKKYSQSK